MKGTMKVKLKKDDLVKVISGKDKGKTGKVLKIDSVKGKILVHEVNLVKKAVKPKSQNEKGGIIDIEAPINISNVMIICKKCGQTRIAYKLDGENKTRICRKCGEAL